MTCDHPLNTALFLRPMIYHVLTVDFPAAVTLCVYSGEQSSQKSKEKHCAEKHWASACIYPKAGK